MPIPRMTLDEEIDDTLYQLSRESDAVKEDCLCIVRHIAWRNGKNPIKNFTDLYRVIYGKLVMMYLDNWKKNHEGE